jgi:hypothetical protein
VSSRRLKFVEFLDNWYIKVISLSALHTGHIHPLEISLVRISLETESTPG